MGVLIENPTPVQALALGIIRDIEEHGHFQAKSDADDGYWSKGRPENPCCVVQSPSWDRAEWDARADFLPAFQKAAGVDGGDGFTFLPDINDTLSTDEVLDALWAVAVG